jgi:hypothetical protein
MGSKIGTLISLKAQENSKSPCNLYSILPARKTMDHIIWIWYRSKQLSKLQQAIGTKEQFSQSTQFKTARVNLKFEDRPLNGDHVL